MIQNTIGDKENMKQLSKILPMLIAAMLVSVAFAGSAFGYDASTPYTTTINYIVTNDTTFTVTLAGAETTIDFNGATNGADIEPDSQNAGTSTPIAVIANAGNVNMDFKLKLTAAQFAYANVTVSAANTYSNPIYLNDSLQTPTGWTAVAPAADVDAYMKVTFTAAPGGTTSRTLEIDSVVS